MTNQALFGALAVICIAVAVIVFINRMGSVLS